MVRTHPNNIAESRRRYARENGVRFTQEDAARTFGVALSTYRNYEQERSLPNAGVISDMADFYGVTSEYLIGRDERPAAVEYSYVDMAPDERELLSAFRQLTSRDRAAVLQLAHTLSGGSAVGSEEGVA